MHSFRNFVHCGHFFIIVLTDLLGKSPGHSFIRIGVSRDSLYIILKTKSLVAGALQKVIEFEAGFEPTCMAHPPTYINKLLLGARDGRLQLWNINTSTLLYTFAGFGSAVRCVEASPALDVVGVGLADGSAALLNIRFDELLMKFENASGVGAANELLLAGGAGQAKPAGGGAVTTLSFRYAYISPTTSKCFGTRGSCKYRCVWLHQNSICRKLRPFFGTDHRFPSFLQSS